MNSWLWLAPWVLCIRVEAMAFIIPRNWKLFHIFLCLISFYEVMYFQRRIFNRLNSREIVLAFNSCFILRECRQIFTSEEIKLAGKKEYGCCQILGEKREGCQFAMLFYDSPQGNTIKVMRQLCNIFFLFVCPQNLL